MKTRSEEWKPWSMRKYKLCRSRNNLPKEMCGQTVLKLTGSLHARDKGNGRCHGLLDVNLREIRPSNLLLICLARILHNSGLPGEEVSLELVAAPWWMPARLAGWGAPVEAWRRKHIWRQKCLCWCWQHPGREDAASGKARRLQTFDCAGGRFNAMTDLRWFTSELRRQGKRCEVQTARTMVRTTLPSTSWRTVLM